MASFVITKDMVFWSKTTDSHEEIIAEFDLQRLDADCGSVQLVRTEISPPDDNYSLPLDQWQFRTDQDLTPGWYDAEDAEKRCRIALVKWADYKIVREGEREVKEGTIHAFDSATVYAYDSATVYAHGSATVHAYDSAMVHAYDSAMVYAYAATVRAFGYATVYAYAATVYAYAATVYASDSATAISWHERVKVTLKPRSKAVWVDRSGNKPVAHIAPDS